MKKSYGTYYCYLQFIYSDNDYLLKWCKIVDKSKEKEIEESEEKKGKEGKQSIPIEQ